MELLTTRVEEQQRELEKQRNVIKSQHQQRRSVTLHTPSPSSSSLQYPVRVRSRSNTVTTNQQPQPNTLINHTGSTAGGDNGAAFNSMTPFYDGACGSLSSVSVFNSMSNRYIAGASSSSVAPPNVSLFNVGHVLQHMDGTATNYNSVSSNDNSGPNSNNPVWNSAETGFPSL